MKRKKNISHASAKPKKAAASTKSKPATASAATHKSSRPIAPTKSQPAASPVPAQPAAQPASSPSQILDELKSLRSLLQSERSAPTSADQVLETGVTSIRRLLSELMEKQTDWILTRLVALRDTAAETPRVARALDALLDELGAVRFRAESLDYVDPLVHTVVEERPVPDMTEGLIVETVRPGYRTGVGTVLAKACVAISRGN